MCSRCVAEKTSRVPTGLPLYPLPPLAFLILTLATIGYSLANDKTRPAGLWSLATVLVGIPLSQLPSPTAANKPVNREIRFDFCTPVTHSEISDVHSLRQSGTG